MLTRKVGERLCGLPADMGRVPLKFTEQQPMIWWLILFIQYPLSSRRQEGRALDSLTPGIIFRNNIHRERGDFSGGRPF